MTLERQGKTDIGRKLSHKVLSLPLGKAVTFAVFQMLGIHLAGRTGRTLQ